MADQDHNPTTTQTQPKRQRGSGRIFSRKGSPFLPIFCVAENIASRLAKLIRKKHKDFSIVE
jgi:hypothetical protein